MENLTFLLTDRHAHKQKQLLPFVLWRWVKMNHPPGSSSSSVSTALLLLGTFGGAAAVLVVSLVLGPRLAVLVFSVSGAWTWALTAFWLFVTPALLTVLEIQEEKSEWRCKKRGYKLMTEVLVYWHSSRTSFTPDIQLSHLYTLRLNELWHTARR